MEASRKGMIIGEFNERKGKLLELLLCSEWCKLCLFVPPLQERFSFISILLNVQEVYIQA